MKILFVSRDNGGAKMSVPTAKLALDRGHEILIVVEGLAADRFQEAGFFNYDSKAKLVFKGPENQKEISFSVEAHSVLVKFRPDVVVATRSVPDSLESIFGEAANTLGIPLVLMEDYWGCCQLYKARPDVVVTLDEYARELAEMSYPNMRVIIAGNPTVIEKMSIPDEVERRVEELRSQFGRVIVFAGGNPQEMTVELQLLIECLKLTEDWCLISRPHPTIAKSDKEPGLKWADYWNGMLSQFGEHIVSVDCKLGDALAVLCDATISGFSLMLNTAAYARRAAISLETEIGKQLLFQSGGLTEVPIVKLGCAQSLKEPCDLGPFIRSADEISLAKLKPFDPAIALKAIESLV
ncbi:MAG: hypothetical protein A2431_02245 [Candidatus Zambryskibacteria bacterium RIFOXYC1_FULL_39_10]|uniref:UDP-N-acetylglucosamine 2-epimerase domain-containing protein n=1 Tax=Candidatus Zambryskibacteria bacterium RIFOXYC1_FULL_39_10 TaxID=1802779 RepID=A0A1G2V3I3_9BACT|nr:MAG: hypothetical protein A2431_02245 [Candidatus Zambryskibacteria bacterium RIFOXYC1_FULL_39_10]OHB16737.1 MAG: hypothetical protein A2605_01095 [Candidatus Zambryskibacteria bacterium RIFOXYD1_FULL_39_35]